MLYAEPTLFLPQVLVCITRYCATHVDDRKYILAFIGVVRVTLNM